MKIRLITGASYVAVLALFYVLKIFVSDLCFDAAIWLFSLIGTFEMIRAFDHASESSAASGENVAEGTANDNALTKAQKIGLFVFAALCIPACALGEEFFSFGAESAGIAFFVLAVYLLSLLVIRHDETGIENTGKAFFAAVYPTVILALLTLANHLPEIAGLEEYAFNSDLAILCIFVISPFADSIAYVFGRFLKKKFPKKMAPHVSPNKTVIGGIGGLVGGLTGAAILYFSYNAVAGSFDKMQLFLPVYLLIGLVTAAATEFGDLVESCVKRKAGIKDMGKLLPGHGGIMDRIDGTLFAAMTVYLVFALFALIMRA